MTNSEATWTADSAQTGAFLQHIGERPFPYILQLISLFLAIPCFKISNFFFKATLLQGCWRLGILREFDAKGFRFSCWEWIMPFKILWGGG